MRLIDADALKKKIEEVQYTQEFCIEHQIDYSISMQMLGMIIDNAPTADDWQKYSDELWKNAYEKGYKQAIIDGKTNFSRLQGEWIVSGYIDTCRGYVAKCSCCKEDTVGGGDFCPN